LNGWTILRHLTSNFPERRLQMKCNNNMLDEFFNDLKTVVQMIADRVRGRYRALPWYCVALLLFAVLYALLPLNWIPLIGMLDDAAVLYLCLKMLGPEIQRYRQWRSSRNGEADAGSVK